MKKNLYDDTSIALILCYLVFFLSCSYIPTRVYKLDRPSTPTKIKAPTKAHLYDGSMILFSDGFVFNQNAFNGEGMYYDLERRIIKPVKRVSADSVIFLEYYESGVEGGPLLGSLLGPIVFIGAITSSEEIKKAIFGSCPTVYSYHNDSYSLQAECFSYSIAPLAEDWDLDRIDGGRAVGDHYLLQVTNEALETHYINHMNLFIADHPREFEAFPTDDEDILLFGRERELLSVTDKVGRDISSQIANRDGQWFRSDSALLKQLSTEITEDWIDVSFEKPDKAQEMCLAFRLRNTLLNTVLFYDVMLGAGGVQALDLIAGESFDILDAWNLNQWYKTYFGLNIQIWNGKEFETAGWIKDTGPIAWHQVGLKLPAPEDKKVKLRLTFLPDNWMIDWIGVSFEQSDQFIIQEIACQQLLKTGGDSLLLDSSLLHADDSNYLVTYPAESYLISFRVPKINPGFERTYFLKSKGYYIEWIRKEWFNTREADPTYIAFDLNEKTITETAKRWRSKKTEIEQDFFSSKIVHLAE
jgi:hypothetical protein